MKGNSRSLRLCWLHMFACAGAMLLMGAQASSASALSPLSAKADWYRSATIYHIWIKSFADSDDPDQVGDLQGIIDRFDYLNDGDPESFQDLGIDTILLSPFYQSARSSSDPTDNIHGYDLTDHYSINPLFGDEETLAALLELAHSRGVRVLFDFVPGYTSILHPWFIDSAQGGEKRNWYLWDADPDPAWQAAWGGGEHWDVWKPHGDRFCYSYFQSAEIADLNFHQPDVRREMEDVLRFWLQKGFDGARIDGTPYLVEDGPGKQADRPGTMKLLQRYRRIAKQMDPKRILMGETWRPHSKVGAYFGNGEDQIHLGIDFNFAWAVTEVVKRTDQRALKRLKSAQREDHPPGSQMATFLSNHDSFVARPITQYSGDAQRALLAAAFQLLGEGTPMIFYGNELGLPGKVWPDAELRALFNWQDVERQRQQPNSLLNGYRTLLRIRQSFAAARSGREVPLLTARSDLHAWLRVSAAEQSNYPGALLTIVNTGNNQSRLTLDFNAIGETGLQPGDQVSALVGTPVYPPELVDGKLSAFEISGMPPKSVTVLYIGEERVARFAGYQDSIDASTTPVLLKRPPLNSLYLRGSMNNWDSSLPMTRDPEGRWQRNVYLQAGRYEYKFEISGTSHWGLNWGDNDRDGYGDVDGTNIRTQISSQGCYLFEFNETDLGFKVEPGDQCDAQ